MNRIFGGIVISALLGMLYSCSAASELLLEPAPNDPLDGYEGSLAEAGVSTDVDWGPQQEMLLSQFKTVQEERAALKKLLEQRLSENENLKASLAAERETVDSERRQRAQSEAEVERLRRTRHDLEAKILALSIENSKLEQISLLAKISNMEQSLRELAPATTDETAAPIGGR